MTESRSGEAGPGVRGRGSTRAEGREGIFFRVIERCCMLMVAGGCKGKHICQNSFN